MNKNLLYLGSILLIILVGLWGYYFYGKNKAINPTPLTYQTKPATSTQSANQPKLSQQTISFNDEGSLLKYIDLSNPTKEQSMKFFETLERVAKLSDVVTISQCKASPVAVKVKLGNDIKVINNDKVDYTLIRATKQYSLPAGQTITIKGDFGGGAHGYRCDGKGIVNQPVAGIFYVVE